MTKAEYERLKETIFSLMCGELDVESYGIENEFASGKECEKLYQELYTYVEQMCDFPGAESYMEKIQENQFSILKLIALKMFDYGWNMANVTSNA